MSEWEECVGGGGSPNPWGKASALDREQISSSLDEYERVDWSAVWGGSEMQFVVCRGCATQRQRARRAGKEARTA